MKKIFSKKGFTIIELVIVIAVIAILCAVFIPTFITLTKKAKLSNDTVLVSNLNKILAVNAASDGSNKLMGDALADAYAEGYVISNLTPTSEGYDIVWDSVNDRFRLYNGSTLVYAEEGKTGEVSDVALWKVYSEIPALEDQKYSIYLRDGSNVTTANIKVGFDVGNNGDLSVINYSNTTAAQEVVIHTNGGNLTVNAATDTVKHYGELVNLHIKAINNSSWHEFGYVNFAQVDSGRFVVENDANVGVAYVESSTATLEGTVAIKLTEADTTAFTKTGDVVTLTYKAYVGNTGYDTVQGAVDAAENGQTVVLLSDVIGNVNVGENQNIIIDFGGHTITSEIMSGTAGFYNAGTVELKNGTFTHSKENKDFYLIVNARNMTLKNLVVTGYAKSSSMIRNGIDDNVQIEGHLVAENCIFEQKGEFVAIKHELGTCYVKNSVIKRDNNGNVINCWGDATENSKMTIENCNVTGGLLFGNCYSGTTKLEIVGGTYDCCKVWEYLEGANSTANAVIKDAKFTNSSMIPAYTGCSTLDVEVLNTSFANDFAQYFTK